METKLTIHSKEAEEAVILQLYQEPHNLRTVINILKPECFALQQPREIYKAMLSLDGKQSSYDFVSITEELKRTGRLEAAGGSIKVADFLMKIVGPGMYKSIEEHAGIIYELFQVRELAGLGMKIYNLANEPSADPNNMVSMITREISRIDFISKNNFEKIGDVVAEIISDQRKVIDEGIKPGIGTGFVNVDKWHKKQKQELGILAARPGMGKTAYMLANAKHTALDLGKSVAIFSLEMSTKKLVGRLMAAESEISSSEINGKTLDLAKLQSLGGRVTRLFDAPMYFDDTAGLDIPSLRTKIRRMVREYKVEEVYIDYLQLMAGDKKGNREQEISYISRNLKMIAKEEDIPIIALSQLSRKVEERNDKRPTLSDLRESGAIEQDADWVIFLYRPEYYGQTGVYEVPGGSRGEMTPETFNGRNVDCQNLLVVDCAKYREGSLFKAALKFYGQFMLIQNYDVGLSEREKPLTPNTDFIPY